MLSIVCTLTLSCQFIKILCSDAYKEFEKEIQEDLREVDDRLEEEEVRLIYIVHYMLTVKKIFTYPLPMLVPDC